MLEAYREKVNAKLRSYFKETECDAFLEEFTMRGGKRI